MTYERRIDVGHCKTGGIPDPYVFTVHYTDYPAGLIVSCPGFYVPPVNHRLYHQLAYNEGFDDETVHRLYKAARIWSESSPVKYGTLAQLDAAAEWCELHRGQRQISRDNPSLLSHLRDAGLYVDNGHTYGRSEVKIDPPDELVEWLFDLPGTGDSYSDILPAQLDLPDEDSYHDVLLNFHGGD